MASKATITIHETEPAGIIPHAETTPALLFAFLRHPHMRTVVISGITPQYLRASLKGIFGSEAFIVHKHERGWRIARTHRTRTVEDLRRDLDAIECVYVSLTNELDRMLGKGSAALIKRIAKAPPPKPAEDAPLSKDVRTFFGVDTDAEVRKALTEAEDEQSTSWDKLESLF